MEEIIVVDASAIINRFPTQGFAGKLITTPKVIDELKNSKIDLEKIEERIPKQEFMEKVSAEVETARDNLSEQDIGLLALALEFKAKIVTDDYGIQNIAAKLGIEFEPVYESGIKKIINWQYYCHGCKKKYEKEGVCEICGTKLRRKIKGKD